MVSVQFRVVIKKRFCDDAESRVVATRERSPPPTSYKDGVSRASRSTLALCMPLIPRSESACTVVNSSCVDWSSRSF
jgi:hypothetical protein